MPIAQYGITIWLDSQEPLEVIDPTPDEYARILNALQNKTTLGGTNTAGMVHVRFTDGTDRFITINGEAIGWWAIDAGNRSILA